MAKVPLPPITNSIQDGNGNIPNVWASFFNTRYKQSGGRSGLDIFPVFYIEATITAGALDSAGSSTILDAFDKDEYKVREIMLSGDGTNYAAGGNRNIAIQDSSGTRIYTIIPNATIESLAAGRWGDTAVAYPTTAADLLGATTPGEDIVAKYSGGSTDHSSTGSLTVMLVVEKVA